MTWLVARQRPCQPAGFFRVAGCLGQPGELPALAVSYEEVHARVKIPLVPSTRWFP